MLILVIDQHDENARLDREWLDARQLDIANVWSMVKNDYLYAWYDFSPGQWHPENTLTPSIIGHMLSAVSGLSGWWVCFDGKGRFDVHPPPRNRVHLKGIRLVR